MPCFLKLFRNKSQLSPTNWRDALRPSHEVVNKDARSVINQVDNTCDDLHAVAKKQQQKIV